MIIELAKGKIWKINKVLKINVHTSHLFLAHSIDKRKLKYKISKGTNNIDI